MVNICRRAVSLIREDANYSLIVVNSDRNDISRVLECPKKRLCRFLQQDDYCVPNITADYSVDRIIFLVVA